MKQVQSTGYRLQLTAKTIATVYCKLSTVNLGAGGDS